MAVRKEYVDQKTLNLQGGRVALKVVPKKQSMADLCDEYAAWCIHQRLPHVDANEQLCRRVTEAQRQWLNDFCKRWDAL
jgi:hypothetical protein